MSSQHSASRRVFQAAGLVAIFLLITRVAGLLREMVLSHYYGLDSAEAVAYRAAILIPDLIFGIVVGGALGSAFIPTFADYLSRDDEAGGWDLFSAILNLILVITTVLALIFAIFARPLLAALFVGPDADPAILPLATRLMQVWLMSLVIFGASSLCMATLNAKQHFLAPAAAGTLYNLGIILGIWLFAPNIMGAAWGAVIGSIAHLAVQLPPLFRFGVRYRPFFNLRDPGVQQVLRLMGPRIIGLSFSFLNRPVIGVLARPLAAYESAFAALTGQALLLVMVPISFLGQAMGTAAFPTLAALAAEDDFDGLRHILNRSLRSIAFLGLPLTAGLMLLRRPLITLLFERGAFDVQDTLFTADVLLYYALALVALTMLEVIARTFYALKDTWTPVVAGFVQIGGMGLLGALFAYWLFPAWGLRPASGIAFAFALSNWAEIIVLLWLLRGRLDGLGGTTLLDGLWRMGVALVVMSVAVWGLFSFLSDASPWVILPVAGAAGAAVYFGVAWLVRLDEVRQVVGIVRRKIGV